MPIIGMNFTKFEAVRKPGTPKGEINVNSVPKITDVKEADITGMGKALSIRFSFATEYSPEVGTVIVEGSLLYMADDNKAALDYWEKNKSLQEEISVPVLNHLFRKCLVKITLLADELQLPPPIQLPRVKGKVDAAAANEKAEDKK